MIIGKTFRGRGIGKLLVKHHKHVPKSARNPMKLMSLNQGLGERGHVELGCGVV